MIAKPLFLSERAVKAFTLDDNRKMDIYNRQVYCLCIDDKYCEDSRGQIKLTNRL